MTKSIDAGNSELVLHVRDQYDLRIKAQSIDERDEIIDTMRDAYEKTFYGTLTIFAVQGGLK